MKCKFLGEFNVIAMFKAYISLHALPNLPKKNFNKILQCIIEVSANICYLI